MNLSNESGSVLEWFEGYAVRQNFNESARRWYVGLPKRTSLHTRFGGRRRMLRSHYVYCRISGLMRVEKSHVIHHDDRNRVNDAFENLIHLTIEDHNRLHENDHHPGSFLGRKHAAETIQKMREIAASRGNNGIWTDAKRAHFESTKLLMSEAASGANNATYRHDIDTEGVRRAYAIVKDLSAVAKIFGCSIQAVRNRLADAPTATNWKLLTDAELQARLAVNGGNVHRTALELNAPLTSLWRRVKRLNKEKIDA